MKYQKSTHSIFQGKASRSDFPILTVLQQGLMLYSFASVLLLFVVIINHISFPMNLEAMEHLVLEHVRRITEGMPIYVEPSPNFIPLAYNPLYYILAVPFVKIFGLQIYSLRILSSLGLVGSGIVIYLALKRESGSKTNGLIGAGMFAAAYRVMDTYLDNAHADSWMLFSILAGCYVISINRSQRSNIIGLVLLVAGFWFKQSAVIFVLGALLYLTWRDGIRSSLFYWLVILCLGPGLYFLADRMIGEYFHFYTYNLPKQWAVINFETFLRPTKIVIRYYPILGLMSFFPFYTYLRKHTKKLSIWMFLLPIALVSGALGALDTESNNNVFILMGVWLIIGGVHCSWMLMQSIQNRFVWFSSSIALVISFGVFFYPPDSVFASNVAGASYLEFVSKINSLDGPVFVPWVGPIPGLEQIEPPIHWVPTNDLIRGLDANISDSDTVRQLLEGVYHPDTEQAYVLMNYPLESDEMLGFLLEKYILIDDFGDMYKPLTTLPKRYNLLWPRYLYRFIQN